MKPDPLPPGRLLQALELFGTQVRPPAPLVVSSPGRGVAEGAERVFVCEQTGADAAACRCEVPAAALRPGHSHYWYVTPTNAGGHDAFAPAEGVFFVIERD